ncbi:hypothetical protein E4695_00920 [Alcaligenaceae bacterium 429]|uniref:hypothetical protein n=1 Tax=Paenalcaligenes sp. Me52 TaxID=3392038 RepID=UPI0010931526|nr:hypothetical protein E4695_00920 [Alcaligenaceae bacterium 429]
MTDSASLLFTEADIDLLARTADALSAYLGKPVLAEVMDAGETGFEWVIFAIPLNVEDDSTDMTVVQIGGANSRLLGSQGGVQLAENETYSCRFLWAVQRIDMEGIRYVKLDEQGDDVGWSETLNELLPFDLSIDDEPDDEESDAQIFIPDAPSRTLH